MGSIALSPVRHSCAARNSVCPETAIRYSKQHDYIGFIGAASPIGNSAAPNYF